MSTRLLRASCAVARAWTRLYTAGARPAAREARRAQIASDLWEHRADGLARGSATGALAIEVAGRVLRGVPADLAWWLGQRRAPRRRVGLAADAIEGSAGMNAPLARKAFLGIALLLGALSLGLAASNSLAGDDSWVIANLGSIGAVLLGVVPAGAIATGLWLRRRWPACGHAIVLAGALAFGVAMLWTIVMPALVLLLVWSALVSARRPVTAE